MHVRRLLILCVLLFFAGCTDPITPIRHRKPGDILSEQVRILRGDFYVVERSIVNEPGLWEGVGHFGFLYFRGEMLCTCNHGQFSISPSNRYAIFHDGPSGKLQLFDTVTGLTTFVKKNGVENPSSFDWKEAEGLVVVELYHNPDNGTESVKPLSIPLR